jgi:hypothetical protein
MCSNSTAYCFTWLGAVVTLPCGQWKCRECSRILALQWAKRAKIGVEHKMAFMWTLTQPGYVKTPAFAYSVLPKQWDKLRRYCQSVWGHWSYFAVVEGQPKRVFMPHFHLLCFHEPPIRLKDLAVQCGFGYQALSEPVRDKRAARYVSKYLTKQPTVVPPHFRRVRVSQDWPPLPDFEKHSYIVKSRKEHWLDFFLRAESITEIDLQTLIDRWNDRTGMSLGDVL